MTLIDGDFALVKEYREAVSELSDWSHRADKLRRRAADVMLRHLATIYDITPAVHGNESDVTLRALWRDIENLPRLVYALKFAYHLQARTLSAIIEELRQTLSVTEESAHDLKTALAIGYCLRATVESHVPSDDVTATRGDVTARALRGASQSMILRAYSVIIPLAKHLRTTIGHKKRADLTRVDLFDRGPHVTSHMNYRLLRYDDAIKCYGSLPNAASLAPPAADSGDVPNKDGDGRTASEAYEVHTRLGLVALQAGNAKEAKGHFGDALEAKNYIEEREKQTLAFVRGWHHMGVVYLADERYQRAISYFTEALDMYDELVDQSATTRPRKKQEFLASVHESMAHAKTRLGLYSEALASFQTAVQHRAALSDGLAGVGSLRLLTALGGLQLSMADFRAALATLKTCLELHYRLCGLHRPSVGAAALFRHLSLALDGLGKPGMAQCYRAHGLSMLERVIDGRLSPGEQVSRDLVVALRELAIARYYARQHAAAVSLFAVCAARLPRGRPLWEGAANDLNTGLALLADDRPTDALVSLQGALDTLVKIYGGRLGNPHLAKCHRGVGSALLALGRKEEAVRHLNTAVGMYRGVGGDEGDAGGHPELADTMDQLAQAHRQLGDDDKVPHCHIHLA